MTFGFLNPGLLSAPYFGPNTIAISSIPTTKIATGSMCQFYSLPLISPAVDERFCDLGEVTLCYETFGEAEDPAVLLIMGLGTQMIAWHEDFCRRLADRGFHVIRFDNRDVGRSTSFDHAKPPTRGEIIRRRPKAAAYDLSDMAVRRDAACSTTWGSKPRTWSAPRWAAWSPSSSPPNTPTACCPSCRSCPTPAACGTASRRCALYPFLLRQPPREREAYLDAMVLLFNAIGSSGYERDEKELRELAGVMFDRGINQHGTERQLAAILSSGDRTSALKRIKAPTLVIHGKSDRLVRHSGGRATAKAIPGARLELIDGMGHDLPRQVWDRIIDGIAQNAARADERRVAQTAG